MEPSSLLNKKVIALTGGFGLLGKVLIKDLLEHGAKLSICDIVENKLVINNLKKEYGENVHFVKADISNENDVNLFFKETLEKFESIDTLINAAAVNPKVDTKGANFSGSIDEIDRENFFNDVSVGLWGAFLCSKVFGNHMAKNKKGNIVNISSDLSIISPDNRLYNKKGTIKKRYKPITYSIVKSGLVGMTKYFATYWDPSMNVRCNSISPGGVFNNQDNEFVKKLEKLIPLGRMARASEFSSCVIFLCSDYTTYMNGHNLVMDGGRSVW